MSNTTLGLPMVFVYSSEKSSHIASVGQPRGGKDAANAT